jgi:cytosol alanyl aminopeptidase
MQTRSLVALGVLTLTGGCPSPRVDAPPPPTASVGAPHPQVTAPGATRLSPEITPVRYALALRVDPKAARFSGKATIDVRFAREARALALHGKDLTITKASFVAAGKPAREIRVEADAAHGLLHLDLGESTAAGEHQLVLEYDAPFAGGLAGMYKVAVDGESYAFTQFEALDARRAFPCFDEPSYKARFTVELTVPDGSAAISNTPVASVSKVGGETRFVFKESELLPTYLIAFAVGPFDIVEAAPIPAKGTRKDPIPLRGVAVKGKGPQLAFALKETSGLLLDLEAYFGIPYPFAKLDIIAVPDFAAGAMENAAAITFREQLLLIDPKSSTEKQRRDIVGVAAHELAHQWFGDLVTMAWWDDLWLNEGFATWMGQRIVHKRYPTWNADLELMGWSQGAMDSDSLVSARKVVQPIEQEEDVENAFDDLTYSKGAAIISMFERFIGEEAFRKGVQRYFDKHRFANASTTDFLNDVLPEASRTAFRQYLERPGVPRVTLEPVCSDGNLSALTVRAERFLPLGSTGKPEMDFELPLCVRTDSGTMCAQVSTAPGKAAPFKIEKPTKCPSFVFPNADGAGYLRYTPTSEQITALFGKPFAALTNAERFAAIDALRASFKRGAADLPAIMSALARVAKDKDRALSFAAGDILDFTSENLVGPEERPAFGKLVGDIYRERFQKVGLTAKSTNEDAETRLLRRDLLEQMVFFARDPAVRKDALGLAKKISGLGSDGKLHLELAPSEIVSTVLTIGVEEGKAEVWDALLLHLKATDDAQLRRTLLAALVSANDEKTAEKARRLLLDPTLKASETLRYAMNLLTVGEMREANWAWMRANLAAVIARIPESSRGYFLSAPAALCDSAREKEIRDAFQPHLKEIGGAARGIDNTVERLKICAAVKAFHAPAAKKLFAK